MANWAPDLREWTRALAAWRRWSRRQPCLTLHEECLAATYDLVRPRPDWFGGGVTCGQGAEGLMKMVEAVCAWREWWLSPTGRACMVLTQAFNPKKLEVEARLCRASENLRAAVFAEEEAKL